MLVFPLLKAFVWEKRSTKSLRRLSVSPVSSPGRRTPAVGACHGSCELTPLTVRLQGRFSQLCPPAPWPSDSPWLPTQPPHQARPQPASQTLGQEQRLSSPFRIPAHHLGLTPSAVRGVSSLPRALGVPLSGPVSFSPLVGRIWPPPGLDAIWFFFQQVNQMQKTVIEPLKK